jgi:hypothetical protein
VTRRVSRAARSWEPLSDAAWRRDVDSVRAALRAQGGVPSCGVWTRRSTSEVREYWRFPEFEIQLFTGGGMMTARTPGTREARWSVFLRGEPRRLCEGFPDPPA